MKRIDRTQEVLTQVDGSRVYQAASGAKVQLDRETWDGMGRPDAVTAAVAQGTSIEPVASGPPKLRALGSRAGWAALWSVLSVITVEQFNLPVEYVPLFAAVLSSVKSFVASKVGDSETVTFR